MSTTVLLCVNVCVCVGVGVVLQILYKRRLFYTIDSEVGEEEERSLGEAMFWSFVCILV